MRGYVVMIKRRWYQKEEAWKQTKNEMMALNIANKAFQELHLDSVFVVAVDSQAEINSDRFNIVYDRTRTCKHKNIQGVFDFGHNISIIRFKCARCDELIIKPDEDRVEKEVEKIIA